MEIEMQLHREIPTANRDTSTNKTEEVSSATYTQSVIDGHPSYQGRLSNEDQVEFSLVSIESTRSYTRDSYRETSIQSGRSRLETSEDGQQRRESSWCLLAGENQLTWIVSSSISGFAARGYSARDILICLNSNHRSCQVEGMQQEEKDIDKRV